MVGWSRRNAEDRERRKQWWDTLTEEQKKAHDFATQESDRKFAIIGSILAVSSLIFIIISIIWRHAP